MHWIWIAKSLHFVRTKKKASLYFIIETKKPASRMFRMLVFFGWKFNELTLFSDYYGTRWLTLDYLVLFRRSKFLFLLKKSDSKLIGFSDEGVRKSGYIILKIFFFVKVLLITNRVILVAWSSNNALLARSSQGWGEFYHKQSCSIERPTRRERNKAICEHSPRLRVIQGYTRLHKAIQGNFYRRQIRICILTS